MHTIYGTIVLAPLIGAVCAGFFGTRVGKRATHMLTICGVALSTVLSLYVLYRHAVDNLPAYNGNVYEWMVVGNFTFAVGFLVDTLTALMMTVVTFVSLCVHIYTVGYMKDDPGYCRFFAYISLFTFAMLMLVMANNFVQLFFGWEAVGLVSYLLIGFWHTKPSAVFANMKAFLVNRVGDFGFLIGIAAIAFVFGSLDYADVFAARFDHSNTVLPGVSWPAITTICLCLFIGAMGKSAQIPLHVWLPDSMEGPTPISALIHAATMVTAGIFMVARMSPLFELSEAALSIILIIGASTALFMGLLGIVQHDIKRVIAYSTLSQLGYMTVALGVSAYSAAIFHLFTHAFFKALLFLGAGSVIMALHHEQDMRRMGGLFRTMPITGITAVIGTLALIGFPGFAGFYSKDFIIEAVYASNRFGSGFATIAVTAGVFITAFYSLRLLQLVFFGTPRDTALHAHAHESPAVVTMPLIVLAIPSICIGALFFTPMLFGSFFDGAIIPGPKAPYTALGLFLHSVATPAFWLMIAGSMCAVLVYRNGYAIADRFKQRFSLLHTLLVHKYGFDTFNERILARCTRAIGTFFSKYGDQKIIDGFFVNGTAHCIALWAQILRRVQTGIIPHYVFAMILGIGLFFLWLTNMLQGNT